MSMKELWPGWTTVEKLGEGGCGSVYKIRRADEGEDFVSALKVISIPPEGSGYDTFREEGYTEEDITTIINDRLTSVVDEYRMMAKFRGVANIVDYEDHRIAPHEDGRGWDVMIRMELLKSLPALVSEKGALTEAEIVRLGRDISRALEICAGEHIVHRDIKPQNIFINRYGDYKLGDFGVARVLDHMTHATKVGTYTYIAPEVYNNRPYGQTADVYSLGLMLYWLLNERRLPFLPLPPAVLTVSANETAMQRRLIDGEALPPPCRGSRELREVVLKACAYDPADRYATAGELRAALERIRVPDDVPVPIPAAMQPGESMDETVVLFGAERVRNTRREDTQTAFARESEPTTAAPAAAAEPVTRIEAGGSDRAGTTGHPAAQTAPAPHRRRQILLISVAALVLLGVIIAVICIAEGPKPVASARIIREPVRMTYTCGETFSPEGMVLSVIYEDGSTDTVGSGSGLRYALITAGGLSETMKTVDFGWVGAQLEKEGATACQVCIIVLYSVRSTSGIIQAVRPASR